MNERKEKENVCILYISCILHIKQLRLTACLFSLEPWQQWGLGYFSSFCLKFWDRVSLCSLGWPSKCHRPASVSWMLVLKAHGMPHSAPFPRLYACIRQGSWEQQFLRDLFGGVEQTLSQGHLSPLENTYIYTEIHNSSKITVMK